MLAFLENEWVIGIGGGIVSGLIVFFINKWIFQRKDNSKYLEQINQANLDIIRTLKPYIAEKGLPEKEIINAIIVSISRKYNVKESELFSIRIVCEELMREIIENVYVSSDKKSEYTSQLNDYLQSYIKQLDEGTRINDIKNELQNLEFTNRSTYTNRMLYIMSIYIALVATLITMLSFIKDSILVFNDFYLGDEIEMILIITVVTILTSYTSIMLIKIEKNRKNRQKKIDNTEHKKNID